MRPTETKSQRLARKFGAMVRAPATNGVPHVRSGHHKTSPPKKSSPALSLLFRLKRQFGTQCSRCFAPVLEQMHTLEPTVITERSEDLARSLYESAKEKKSHELLHWANYKVNGLRLFERLILDAVEAFTPAPAVDATFVWLYFDGERQGDELRWSIRSVLDKYNGQASVIVFGDKPSWYCGPYFRIPRVGAQPHRRFRDTLNKLYAACTSPLVPDTFVWMMDDTYFLRRVSMRDLDVNRYQGSIPAAVRRASGFSAIKAAAFEAVRQEGLPCVDYCTHLPKVVEKAKFLDIWQRFNLANRVLAWELLYGACFYDNFRPVDDFFGLVLNSSDLPKIKRATIVNNGTRGWSETLRAELWNRFPVQSAFESSPEKPPNWKATKVVNRRYNYEIRSGYRCRAENNKGISVPDAAQRNVYEYAAAIPNVTRVIDLGTGSGSKLVELFGDRQTVGVDVAEKVAVARSRFPKHDWRVLPTEIDCDLLIVADVIEHLADPLELMNVINAGNWRHCVISTPERDLARGVNDRGPPKNPRHVREWNTGEFVRFLRKYAIGEIESVRVLGEYNLVVTLRR